MDRSQHEPGTQSAIWEKIIREWLALLGPALGEYGLAESEHFILLAGIDDKTVAPMLQFAERCVPLS